MNEFEAKILELERSLRIEKERVECLRHELEELRNHYYRAHRTIEKLCWRIEKNWDEREDYDEEK